MPNKCFRKIVVRCPNWVGDLVMCTPSLRSLRLCFVDAHIAIMVKPSLRPVIEQLPYFDEIIEYEPKGSHRGWKKYVSMVKTLKKKQFDLGILMPHSFSSALLFFLAAIPARAGYNRNARGWMLTHKVPPPQEQGVRVPMNMVDLYLTLTGSLGCKNTERRVELRTSPAAEQWVSEFFARRGIKDTDLLIVIIPGATFGSSKCWQDDSFAAVADALIDEYQAKILIIPGPGELPIACSIIQKMQRTPVGIDDQVLPLDVLMALIRRCSLLITNDTGPRHFGVAFRKPIIVILGPTDERYTDYQLEHTVIIKEPVACAPCHLKECPVDHRCMTLITPDRVLAAARTIINQYYPASACEMPNID